MAIKTFKPTSNGLRQLVRLDNSELSRKKPEKSLVSGKPSVAGRDSNGRISVWHKGGGHKRRYREIDFRRSKEGVEGRVKAIEYDPNRSANIALIFYKDGDKRYIISPKELKVGAKIMSGPMAAIETGNCLPLEEIPLGFTVHNVELTKGKGAQLARSAGASAIIAAKEGDYVTLKLPSGEMRMIFKKCTAVVGLVGNEDHMNTTLGKAGRSRWLGIRPTTRGMVMNPVDHPHGGGEGKNKGIHPVTPWGQPCKGYKTRNKRKTSSRFIVGKKKK